MESVGSTLQNHIYDGAAVVAKLCGKAVVLNFEFLHAFDQRLVVDICVSALALFRRANQGAVHPNLRGRVPLAVGNKICSGGIVVLRARPGCLRHTPSQKR